MLLVLRYTLAALRAVVRERRELALENIALRHQVEVLARGRPRERQAQSLREQASVSSRCAVSVARRHPGAGTCTTLRGRGSGTQATLAPVAGRGSDAPIACQASDSGRGRWR